MNQIAERKIALEAARWIGALEEGELSESAEFIEWVCQDPRHLREFFELSAISDCTRQLSSHDWAHLNEHVRRRAASVVSPFPIVPSEVAVRRVSSPTARRGVAWRVSAGVAACLLSITAVVWLLREQAISIYQTGANEIRLVNLEDGSRLHLNSRTRLQVRFNRDGRDVELVRGEALFEVVHDPSRPFRVRYRGTLTEALGTRFDVRSYSNILTVTVDDGRVMVMRPPHVASRRSLEIRAGQRASVSLDPDTPSGEISTLDARQMRGVLGWTAGVVDLRSRFMKEVITEFNRANAPQIVIDDPSIANLRLSGRFNLGDPETFVAALRSMHIASRATGSGDSTVWHLSRSPVAPARN